MRSACAPSTCNSGNRPLRSWIALAIGLAAIGHFFWEAMQLPLYTLWRTGAPREIAFALFHCTVGDVLITTATFAAAVALAWHLWWPPFGWRMVFTAIMLGAGYTIFSEWLNVEIRRTLVLYRGDAGCSFPWHRPDTFAAMADCSRPGTCHHWLSIPPGPPSDALRGPT